MDLEKTRILALVISTRCKVCFSVDRGQLLLASRGKIKLYKKYGPRWQEEEVLNRFWHFSGVAGEAS